MKFILLLCLLLGVSFAQTEEGGEARIEALAEAGAAAYDAGDYVKAVGLYIRANQLEPNAPLIYNIAVIYERKIDDPQLAIQFYRRYIGSPDVDPEKIPVVNERIIKLKLEIQKREAARAKPDKPAEPTSVKIIKVIQDPIAPPPPPKPSVAPWLVIGTGAALGIAGGVFGVMAQRSADDFDESDLLAVKRDAKDRSQTQALTADILGGAGVAALTIGVIMLWVEGDDASASKASIGFSAHEGGGRVHIGGFL
ncbi:hypothetical protein KKF91_15310 [Myxococcota bacterium]|nr:hypothetical protein [Myxococcota bacterium]MBU1431909.1 hypothetical protein [Myxococcota bacterium]MBU1897058.1 hypothetical protein [Myxococcota bacterium]